MTKFLEKTFQTGGGGKGGGGGVGANKMKGK